jgi:hypothetical protein
MEEKIVRFEILRAVTIKKYDAVYLDRHLLAFRRILTIFIVEEQIYSG